MNVLIVEDERQLSHEIEIFLSKQGYHCDVAFSGKSASEKIFVNSYDFILLDVGLPDTSGFQLLKEAKEGGKDAAFILITARGSIDDKITGLDLGADDYLAKPFSLLELQARMQAILRRKHGLKNNTIPIHDFVMDIQNRTLLFGKDTVNLTKKEFDILHYMALHKNRVITRVQLTEHIWGDILEEDYESNYIDVHIKNLRKKGIGYRLNMP